MALVILVFQICHTLVINGGPDEAKVKVWLDQAVANNHLRNLFLELGVKHLVAPSSDHAPIL